MIVLFYTPESFDFLFRLSVEIILFGAPSLENRLMIELSDRDIHLFKVLLILNQIFMFILATALSSGPSLPRFFLGSFGKLFVKTLLRFQFTVIKYRRWNFGLLLVNKTQI